MAAYGTYSKHKELTKALEGRLNTYARIATEDLDDLTDELAAIASSVDYDGKKPFAFSDYGKVSWRLDSVRNAFAAALLAAMLDWFKKEWGNANGVVDTMATNVLKDRYGISQSTIDIAKRATSTNDAEIARVAKAFTIDQAMMDRYVEAARKRWSPRVWDLTRQHVRDMENAITVCMSGGISAQKLANKVKPYLNEPDRLYRRVRDKYGQLQLSLPARDYHPGRGVYRSSYANAMRLARSEINMAYRIAEQVRWQTTGFVVGYRVRVSYARHKPDICDDLAGDYSLKFLWTGWHPNCLCTCVPIMKTLDEFTNDVPIEDCGGYVDGVPDNFTDWVADNSDRIRLAGYRGKLPFFLQDNQQYYSL